MLFYHGFPTMLFCCCLFSSQSPHAAENQLDKPATAHPAHETAIVIVSNSTFPQELKQQLVEHYQEKIPNVYLLPDGGCRTIEMCIKEAKLAGSKQLFLVNTSTVVSPDIETQSLMATLRLSVALYDVKTQRRLSKPVIFSGKVAAAPSLGTDWGEAIAQVTEQESYNQQMMQIAEKNSTGLIVSQ